MTKYVIIDIRIYPGGLVSVKRQLGAVNTFRFKPYYPTPSSLARIRRFGGGVVIEEQHQK